ncbi:uncharacterized protein [Ptychodera flava]|uniref:uncharacterized protein n=1 Tax=Ptychodera flava TaxID=63121 RepID=UPI00396A9828
MVRSNTRKIGATDVQSNTSYRLAMQEIEDARFCWGLCCAPGLVTGVIVCIYFIIFLPTGLFLTMIGGRKKSDLIPVGVVVIVAPIIGFLIFISTRWHRNRARRKSERERSASIVEITKQDDIVMVT